MVAARYSDEESVRSLLRHGARVDIRNKEGETALIVGSDEVVELLVEEGEKEKKRK
jgi:ankyrin repeat protein